MLPQPPASNASFRFTFDNQHNDSPTINQPQEIEKIDDSSGSQIQTAPRVQSASNHNRQQALIDLHQIGDAHPQQPLTQRSAPVLRPKNISKSVDESLSPQQKLKRLSQKVAQQKQKVETLKKNSVYMTKQELRQKKQELLQENEQLEQAVIQLMAPKNPQEGAAPSEFTIK